MHSSPKEHKEQEEISQMTLELDAKLEAFWQAYLASLPDAAEAARRFYEAFAIGDSSESADEGAALIKRGAKTATSSLLWEYQATGKPLPVAGSLSIVRDGRGNPVCVVESTAVEIRAFAEVDAAFAQDYGEWDLTLATWKRRTWEYYAPGCVALGKAPALDMPLVCERFEVVYT